MRLIQQFILVVAVVFIAVIGFLFVMNLWHNPYNTGWSTANIVVAGAIVGVVTFIVGYLLPQNRVFGLGAKDQKRD